MQNSDYITHWIGNKIKEFRQSENLKLIEMAERTGISVAMLSKIENGRIIPTLPTLIQVLNSIKIDLNSFFSDLPNDNNFPGYIHIQRSDYKEIAKEESIGYKYELILNKNIEKSGLEISLLTLQTESQREKVTTSGFEYLYIINGEIDYYLNDDVVRLRTGDSLYFDGNIPHVPVNKGESEASILVVLLLSV